MSDSRLADSTDRDCWIGFDLGGTKMMAAVCDSDFEVIGRKRKATKASDGVKAVVNRLKQLIRRAVDEADVTLDRIAGIGIGVPGPVDMEQGTVLETPNIGMKDLPLKSILEEEFECPVCLANDVDMGIYGEYRLGAARGSRCAAGLFPGTGIGGGCVYGGRILTGSQSSAFEIGHLRILPDGPLCGCGRHGCLEAVASRPAMAAAAAQAAMQGMAPYLMESVGTDLSNIRSGALAESIRQGDSVVEEIVRNGARQLGLAAGWMVNLLGPDMVVLGGGMVEAMPELYRQEVQQAAEAQVLPSFRGTFEVCVAELGDYAVVKGAAAWAQFQRSTTNDTLTADESTIRRTA